MSDFNPKCIKGFVCDLDGTLLLPDAVLGKRTIEAVRACRERGLHFVIATGRSLLSTEKYRSDLELDGAMIYYNGAQVISMPEGRLVTHNYLEPDVAEYCIELSRKYDVHFHIFFVDSKDVFKEILMSEKPSHEVGVYEERTGLSFSYGNLNKMLKESAEKNLDCVKGIFIADPPELEKLRSALIEKFGYNVNAVKSADILLEVLNKNTSKGDAMKAALSAHGISVNEVISFGDEENDISMLQIAGYSCAPSNAKPLVKRAAKTVIGNNKDEALAEFLEKYFL